MKNRNLLLFGLGLFVSFELIGQVPKSGLVVYFPFNGDAGDSSGNAINGTVYGADLTTDRFGDSNSAYYFNGTSDYISLPGSSLKLSQYTYSLWAEIKTLPGSGTQYMVMAIGSSGGDQHINALNNDPTGNGWGVGVYNTTTPTIYEAYQGANLKASEWVHVAVTRSANVLRLYVNGTEVDLDSSASPTSPNYGSGSTIGVIGARNNLTYHFNGKIDDVRIYNRPLSASEVDQLFQENTLDVMRPLSDQIRIYPTPAKDNLIVQVRGTGVVGDMIFRLIDLSGREIKSEKHSGNSCELNLSELSVGVYVLQISDGNGKYLYSEKIVKD
jgi:hypothetical protein